MSLPPAHVPHHRLLLAGLGIDMIVPAQSRTAVDTAFLDFLIREFARLIPFDAEFYASQVGDLAAAMARGDCTDAQDHFLRFGYRDGKLPHRLTFDAAAYVAQNPDLAGLQAAGGTVALAAHFLQHGRFEGRSAHPDTAADAARWAVAVDRTQHELAHRTFDGALVQAFLAPLLGPVGRGFRGGPVLGDTPVDLLLRHRRADRAVDSFPPSDAPVAPLGGEYVYGGPYCDHFGHAMAEMIHRVLPSRALFDCRRLLFAGLATGAAPSGFEALPPVMQAPLLFMEVDPADVTVIHDNRVVERLHIAQQGSDLTSGPRASYRRMLAEYTPARLAALPGGGAVADRLYVSRSRIIHGGLLLGERYLERLLQREGWQVLHPQELPLVEQMRAYRGAGTLIFAEGSACHGAELFGTDGLHHCVLLPRREASRHVFESTLRPRARRFDTLPSATLLGSVLADARTGAAMDNLGVSVFDIGALARGLRELELAQVKMIDAAAYRRAALGDLEAHLAHHRAAGTTLVSDVAIAALRARCREMLR